MNQPKLKRMRDYQRSSDPNVHLKPEHVAPSLAATFLLPAFEHSASMPKLIIPPSTGGRPPSIRFIEYIFSLNVLKHTHRLWTSIVEAASPAAVIVIVITGASLCLILPLLIRHVKRQKFRVPDEEYLPHDCKLRLDEKTSLSLLIERRPPNVPGIFSDLPAWRLHEESW